MRSLLAILFTIAAMVIAPDSYAQEQTHIRSADGTALAFKDTGEIEKPVILFIHGWSLSQETWTHQYNSELAEHFRLVSFDLRGHGASEKPVATDRYTNGLIWAGDLDAVLNAIDQDQVLVVASSFAGRVVMDYIRHFGTQRLSGLVLMAPELEIGRDREPLDYSDPDVQALVRIIDHISRPDYDRQLPAVEEYIDRQSAVVLDEKVREQLFASVLKTPYYVRQAIFLRKPDNRDLKDKIDVPTMLVHGDANAIVPLLRIEQLHADLPDSKLLIMPDIGHAPFLEDPDVFNREVKVFYKEILEAEN